MRPSARAMPWSSVNYRGVTETAILTRVIAASLTALTVVAGPRGEHPFHRRVLRINARKSARHGHQLAEGDRGHCSRHRWPLPRQQLAKTLIKAVDDPIGDSDADQRGDNTLGDRPNMSRVLGCKAMAIVADLGLPVHADQDSTQVLRLSSAPPSPEGAVHQAGGLSSPLGSVAAQQIAKTANAALFQNTNGNGQRDALLELARATCLTVSRSCARTRKRL